MPYPSSLTTRSAQAPRLGVEVLARIEPEWAHILAPEALDFVARLERRFRPWRETLLERRRVEQARLDAGFRPDFLSEGKELRERDWTIGPLPADLRDRRVEVVGPPDRQGLLDGLNSGAKVFVADFGDATSPTWRNLVEGQRNLRDAVRGEIRTAHPETGKECRLNERVATLMVRPRAWHLTEERLLVDGSPASASLFDFGLHVFHNARTLLLRRSAPYFSLSGLEGHLDARLWNDVFAAAEEDLGIPSGWIKATVRIDTILAAFEMDEILFELRERSAGLQCGRLGYLGSFVRHLGTDPGFALPDRATVGTDRPFLRSLGLLLIETCHRRDAPAIGATSADVCLPPDPERDRRVLAIVRAEKRRDAEAGHDGASVVHPSLVRTAREEFDEVLTGPNQIYRRRRDLRVTAGDLLAVSADAVTEAGLRRNLRLALLHLEGWLRGAGQVLLEDRLEDGASAELARAQVWQWVRQGASLEDGRKVDAPLVRDLLKEEMEAIRASLGEGGFAAGRFEEARGFLESLAASPTLEESLPAPAYALLRTLETA